MSTAQTSGPGSARIASVSSDGHATFGVKGILYSPEEVKNFGDFGRYGLAKLANILHAKTLNEQYGPNSKSAAEGRGEIWAASLHPGFIDTQMNEKNKENASWKLRWIHPVLQWFGIMRPWDERCVASLFVSASPDFKVEMSGLYFSEKAVVKEPSPAATNIEERQRLEKWTVEKMKAGGWI